MNEVVAELDGSDFEDSEDDFDGYLDIKNDNGGSAPGGSAPVNVINYDNARISNLYLRLSTQRSF